MAHRKVKLVQDLLFCSFKDWLGLRAHMTHSKYANSAPCVFDVRLCCVSCLESILHVLKPLRHVTETADTVLCLQTCVLFRLLFQVTHFQILLVFTLFNW